MSKPLRLVIIGRPNVGKSTLFNRLFGRRRALVHDEPGVTRDRLEEKMEWWRMGKRIPVVLVDTGGLGGDRFSDEIAKQVDIALQEADVVAVLFDGRAGLTPADQEVILQVKRAGIKVPMIGVVNKIDAELHEPYISDFYASGLDPLLTISAEHGRGIDDLKEAILQSRPEFIEKAEEPASEEETELEEEAPRITKIAVVGRPNVGKSTLVNALLAQDRMITSPIAGTTVDAIDSLAHINGKPFLLIDTAGIRRKNKTNQGIEVLSVVQARKALERCDVACLLLDGETGITEQDEKIGGIIEDVGCSVVLIVNKWDTQERNRDFSKDAAAERIRGQMAYLKYAPIVFTSALKKRGIENLDELIEEIMNQRRVKVTTHDFTEWVRVEAEIHNPMNAKFYLCHQSGRNPPTFVCHVNDPEKVHFSLKRHLLNAIRARWGFMGTPIRLLFVKGGGGKGHTSAKRKK